jgi:hypothetical protein
MSHRCFRLFDLSSTASQSPQHDTGDTSNRWYRFPSTFMYAYSCVSVLLPVKSRNSLGDSCSHAQDKMNFPCLRRRSQTSIYYVCQGCQSFHEQPLGRVVENVHAKSGNVNLQYKTQGGPSTPSRCTECGSTLHVAGPMWSAPIHNKAFVGGVLEHLEENKDKYGTAQRMHGMLTLAHEVSICCHPQVMYTADRSTGAELAVLFYTLQDRKLLSLRNTISRQHGLRTPPRRPRSLT